MYSVKTNSKLFVKGAASCPPMQQCPRTSARTLANCAGSHAHTRRTGTLRASDKFWRCDRAAYSMQLDVHGRRPTPVATTHNKNNKSGPGEAPCTGSAWPRKPHTQKMAVVQVLNCQTTGAPSAAAGGREMVLHGSHVASALPPHHNNHHHHHQCRYP